jgi:hypothetical protein
MKRIILVIIMVASLLVAPGVARAGTTRVEVTGSEWCDMDTFIFDRIWESGLNLHIDGITQTCYDTASIPQLTGIDYLYDAQLKYVGNGPNFNLSGKLRMESAEGGTWEGSWVLPANTTIIQVVAHGEGLYEGQHLYWFLDEADGSFSGYIKLHDE